MTSQTVPRMTGAPLDPLHVHLAELLQKTADIQRRLHEVEHELNLAPGEIQDAGRALGQAAGNFAIDLWNTSQGHLDAAARLDSEQKEMVAAEDHLRSIVAERDRSLTDMLTEMLQLMNLLILISETEKSIAAQRSAKPSLGSIGHLLPIKMKLPPRPVPSHGVGPVKPAPPAPAKRLGWDEPIPHLAGVTYKQAGISAGVLTLAAVLAKLL